MEIHELQNELNELRRLEEQNRERMNRLEYELQRMRLQTPVQSSQVTHSPEVQPIPQQNVQPVYQQNVQPVYDQKKNSRVPADMEKVIGKSWMGVLASILIFLSLFIFAKLLIPLLTNEIKMVIMYTFSFAFLGFGVWLVHKKQTALNISICSCGLGALYISMLLSNVYFKVISDIILYLLILVWGVGVAYLSRSKSKVFLVIGHIGINFSVIFGVLSCIATEKQSTLFLLCVFFLLSSIVFEIFNRNDPLIHLSFETVNFVLLCLTALFADFYELPYKEFGLLILIAIVLIVSGIVKRIKVFALFHLVPLAFILLISATWMQSYGINDYLFSFFIYGCIVSDIFITLWYYWQTPKDTNYILISVFHASIMLLCFIDLNSIICILLVPLVLILIGELSGNMGYKIESFITIGIVILSTMASHNLIENILELVFLIGVFCGIAFRNQVKNRWMRTIIFILLHLSVLKFIVNICYSLKNTFDFAVPGQIRLSIILAVLLFIHLIFKLISEKTEDNALAIACYGSSGCLSLTSGLQLISLTNGGDVNYYIALLVSIGIFSNYVYRLIRSGNAYKQIYATIKVTAYIILVMCTLQKAAILLSIALLILAIVWITIGFALHSKVIRIYGLIVTIISIMKLILLDISYNSSLEKAAGFFVCGILCFAISLIYHKIDKNMEKAGE